MATRRQSSHLKALFLESFATVGNVTIAAQSAGIDRTTVYKWLEHSDDFQLAFRQAEVQAIDILEHAGWKRAVDGVTQEHGVYSQGVQVAVETKIEYSDTLLMFLLKARDPKKYRDRVSIDYGDTPTDKLLEEARTLGLVTAGDRPA
jgi:hypothetical protein